MRRLNEQLLREINETYRRISNLISTMIELSEPRQECKGSFTLKVSDHKAIPLTRCKCPFTPVIH